ncbi:septum formation inhibitor Maf [Catenovulum sp. SM1970]|uniref:Maf family protein n=1 Tax=Marinifaba aquimaris TaxID=2741323 RepID=UPI001574A88D|nr:nucleoside triphosphate pyrophosphatase [Marinifaba aquimaris]NTS75875.1 septum formation inhibitor Maf [Marinifaba aquimaris]
MIILASQSPRRRELLTQLGVEFEVLSADIDETELAGESPTDLVVRLAVEKAKAVQAKTQTQLAVLGSDTVVVSPSGEAFGKPIDLADATRMLSQLSNATHSVFTAIAIVKAERVWTELVETKVSFCQLTENDIQAYWQSGEPQDKAGSYGIQGIGGKFVTSIEGNYSAVVGLPLYHTDQLLKQINENKDKS